MLLTIDNFDGMGPVDYSQHLSGRQSLSIERKLNTIALCSFVLSGCDEGFPVPSRNGRVTVADDVGTLLFTGYMLTEPRLEYVGDDLGGAVHEAVVSASSDEVLLNRQGVPQGVATSGQFVTEALQALTSRVGPWALSVTPGLEDVSVSHFLLEPGPSWSLNAGKLLTAACASYKAIDDVISVTPMGAVVHALDEADGSLQVSGLSASRVKAPANDIVVCGECEPTAYVTEVFRGDGSTSEFQLTRLPFFPAGSRTKPLKDEFQEAALNSLLWTRTDPTAAIGLSGTGLKVTGGTGADGETTLASIDKIELGGLVVAEVCGVEIQTAGEGILGGLYAGEFSSIGCFLGFRITPGAGGPLVTPVVEGAPAGISVTLQNSHKYTCRARVYCREAQRVLQTFRYMTGEGPTSMGGDAAPYPAHVTMELQDVTLGANGAVTVLYDAAIPFAPSACHFVPVSSSSLAATMQSAAIRQLGSTCVTTQLSGGVPVTRRIGDATEGAECQVSQAGRVHFYPSSVPATGVLVAVTYRIPGRSVSRLSNQDSIDQDTNAHVQGRSTWAGTVLSPACRSSQDCENAAAALLASSCDRNAAWAGTYTVCNPQGGDIWPGDLLDVSSDSSQVNAQLLVRTVQLEIAGSSPSVQKYTVQFSNDWAEPLAIKTTSTVPADAWIPSQPVLPGDTLANLPALSIGSISGTAIAIEAGATTPSGGGFEVRRRDWAFRPGNDADLVLRSPVANFSIPRESAGEAYYVRMYDGSTPPRYSRFSSALWVNVPTN